MQEPGVEVKLQDDAQRQGHAQHRIAARRRGFLLLGLRRLLLPGPGPTATPVLTAASSRVRGSSGVPEQKLTLPVLPDVLSWSPGRRLLRGRTAPLRAQEGAVVDVVGDVGILYLDLGPLIVVPPRLSNLRLHLLRNQRGQHRGGKHGQRRGLLPGSPVRGRAGGGGYVSSGREDDVAGDGDEEEVRGGGDEVVEEVSDGGKPEEAGEALQEDKTLPDSVGEEEGEADGAETNGQYRPEPLGGVQQGESLGKRIHVGEDLVEDGNKILEWRFASHCKS